MKIIQSFSQFEEGSPYVGNIGNVYVNFYTFLLSFLSIKKYYGEVTMHCNSGAYESFIKFIPYTEIVLRENKNIFNYWNFYKIDSIRETKEDVIHVDPDVFIFNPLFDNFVYGKSDGIVQDTLTPEKNKKVFVGHFVDDNKQRLIDLDIFDSNIYDGRCYSCGVLGIRESLKSKYFDMVNKLMMNIESNSLVCRYSFVNAICEELGYYLTALKYGLNVHEVLPYDYIEKYGQAKTGNIVKYTHLWFGSKFRKVNVDKIKEKIRKEYPNDYHLIKEFEDHLKDNSIVLTYID